MPFDFKKYDAKCASMSSDELQREWEHYTRLISGSATSTAVSGLAIPFTMGVSSIGVGLASASIHNARKKREIIDKYLLEKGEKHNTRRRDVLAPMAVSGTVGVLTLGVGAAAADAITNQAAERAFTTIAENELAVKVTTHLALDAAVMAGEEEHMKNKKAQEAAKFAAKAENENEKPNLPTRPLPTTIPSPSPQSFEKRPFWQMSNYDSKVSPDAQFGHLGVPVSVYGNSRPPSPAPPYSPTPGVFVNSDGKPTDTATVFLPPPPPQLSNQHYYSNNGYIDERRKSASFSPIYFPPPPPRDGQPQSISPMADGKRMSEIGASTHFPSSLPQACQPNFTLNPYESGRNSSIFVGNQLHPPAFSPPIPLMPTQVNMSDHMQPAYANTSYFPSQPPFQQYTPAHSPFTDGYTQTKDYHAGYFQQYPVPPTGLYTPAATPFDDRRKSSGSAADCYFPPPPNEQRAAPPTMYFPPPPTSR